MYDDDPGWRSLFNLLGALYHQNPVKLDIAGTTESIAEISADLLYRCYHTFYSLGNMVLTVAGNFRPEVVLEAADKILKISVKNDTRCLILRMRSVNAIDATAMHSLEQLYENYEKKKIQIILSHVNNQPRAVMEKSGFTQKVGAENFCAHIDEALERAKQLNA